jgi:UDP-N-acetyl-D-mannosaminuronate dehydrogenase
MFKLIAREDTTKGSTTMTISGKTVAIIGAGNIGSRLAAGFAAGGQDFLLAGRDLEATRKLASDFDGHAGAVSIGEAVERADVLVLAVWFDAFKEFIAQYGERLAGKVIVDPTNPVAPDGNGGSSRRSAHCRPTHCPRPHGGSPSARCCSTPPTTTQRAT